MKIHYHSDCYFFAGSENIIVNLLNNKYLNSHYRLSFSFPDFGLYKEGLFKRIKSKFEAWPIFLPDNSKLKYWMQKTNRNNIILILLQIFLKIMESAYVIFLYDLIRLTFLFKRIKPDIVHINAGGYPAAYSCRAAAIAAKRAGVGKILYHVNNIALDYSNYGIITRAIEEIIDRKVVKHVDIFVTGSFYAKTKLYENRHINLCKIMNIPNTIIQRPVTETAEETKCRIGLSNDDIIFLNVALLTERKGHSVLIKAFKKLLGRIEEPKKIKLVIEGTGEDERKLVILSHDLGIIENISFIGNEINIYNIYNIASVFVLSSIKYEDFPNTIIEAMFMGKPVIGTCLAGIPEQIENGVNGFLVPCGDEDALCDAMFEFIKNTGLIKYMGENSKKLFNERFSYNMITDKYIKLYQ